jgi:hypothetical protein
VLRELELRYVPGLRGADWHVHQRAERTAGRHVQRRRNRVRWIRELSQVQWSSVHTGQHLFERKLCRWRLLRLVELRHMSGLYGAARHVHQCGQWPAGPGFVQHSRLGVQWFGELPPVEWTVMLHGQQLLERQLRRWLLLQRRVHW